jgi:RNA polymerase sigma-70 factor (ECF subfamily)
MPSAALSATPAPTPELPAGLAAGLVAGLAAGLAAVFSVAAWPPGSGTPGVAAVFGVATAVAATASVPIGGIFRRSRPTIAPQAPVSPTLRMADDSPTAADSWSGGAPDRLAPSDEALLVASRSGDRNAFRVLIERYRDDLLRFLVRFLGSRTAADDVFQETFLQVHLASHSFDQERRFRPWLYAIASNKARDYHRRNRRRPMASLSAPLRDGEGSLAELIAEDRAGPDAPASAAEIASSVKRLVDEMPSHYREILLLAYFQKLSYQQIADALAIPLGTVKSRLHASVAHFASAWKAERGDADPLSDDPHADRPADR